MKRILIAKTIFKKGFILEWITGFNDDFDKVEYGNTKEELKNDIQVILKTNKGKYLADAICHYGSYGEEDNLWEIMVNNTPKAWGGSVKGYLTWKMVEKYFDREIRLTQLKKKVR